MVDTVYAHTSKKLSKESMDEFKECFGKEIILQKASYNQDGQCSELEYGCDHPFLDEFRRCLKTWLNDQDFPFRYFICWLMKNYHGLKSMNLKKNLK